MEDKVSILVAFFSGVLSFFSPCVLPLVPLYICFITGLSIDKLTEERKNMLGEIVLFCLGFSFVFIILGLSATVLGNFVDKNKEVIRTIGGIIIILFGLHILGLFNIKYLNFEKRLHLSKKPLHILGSFVVGMVFAAGWTPCIGPILGAILALSATQKTLTQGGLLLSSYSLGLALPFLLTGLAINKFLNFFDKVKKHFRIVSVISGILLIMIGLMLISGGIRL